MNKTLEWPTDYIHRKLDASGRLSELEEGPAAECARELWELLMEAEALAAGFKKEAEAVEEFQHAVSVMLEAAKAIKSKRRAKTR